MDKKLKKFIIKIIIFSFILMLVSGGLFATILKEFYFIGFPYLFILFISISIIVHSILLKAAKKRPARFSADFMLTVILKLFLYSACIGIYAYLDKQNIKPFAVSVLAFYFLYTFFDVKTILSDLSNKSEEDM